MLRSRRPAELHHYLRRRLDRWPLVLLPGRRAGRALRAFSRIQRQVAPCVWAATFRAMVDGWPTARGLHGHHAPGRCAFGCTLGQDDIRHYAYCPHAAALAQRHLGLPPLSAPQGLDEFLLLQTPANQDEGHLLVRRALACYAIYRASNARRHDPSCVAADVWTQAWREAASGGIHGRGWG